MDFMDLEKIYISHCLDKNHAADVRTYHQTLIYISHCLDKNRYPINAYSHHTSNNQICRPTTKS